VPLAASASSSASLPAQHPYFIPWKLGTPLPTVPAGDTLVAQPNPAAWKGVTHGAIVPTTPVALPTDTTAAAESAATTAYTCGPYNFNYDEGQQVAAVAQSYDKDAHDTMGFTYGQGQNNSLEAGISATDAYGSFSDAGNVSVATFGKEPFPSFTGIYANYWRTFFDWTDYYQVCTDLHDGLPPYTNYFSQPTSWIQSDNVYHPGMPAVPPVCGQQLKTSKPSISETTAKTINVAFNVLGLGGSAQAGYDTTLTINFVYNENGWLCGDTKYPTPGFNWPMAIP
jgi:hypothetical protein